MKSFYSNPQPVGDPNADSRAKDNPKQRQRLPLISEHIFDKVSKFIPDFLIDPFRTNQRKLMAVERKMQRQFINEYKSQVRSLEPVLRERGYLIGRAIVSAFTGQQPTQICYADAAEGQKGSGQSIIDPSNNFESLSADELALAKAQLQVREIMITLDPIIAPVLDPFVEGLKSPINEKINGIQSDIYKVLTGTAAVSLVMGYALGRITAGSGGSRSR